MASHAIEDFDCSIALALNVVGEWWTLMILRNCFHGMRNFDQFQGSLGISSSVLSDRLRKLVDSGVLKKVQSENDGRAYEYRLTETGLKFYPILVALNDLGETLAPGTKGRRMTLLEKTSGEPIAGVAVLSRDGAQLQPWDVLPVPGPAASDQIRELLQAKQDRH